jgi:hypothetical protein
LGEKGEKMHESKVIVRILLALVILFGYNSVIAAECKYEDFKSYYGSEANPTGNPIGGGKGYNDIKTTGNYIVKTRTELLNALSAAKSGEVIFIPGNAVINLNNTWNINIPGGVTIASDRGLNGSPGALIYNHGQGTGNETTGRWQFITRGTNVRITGLRIEGPDGTVRTYKDPGVYPFCAILTKYADLEVDNCEIYNWNASGVYVDDGGKNAFIHHNYFHHIQMHGLGDAVLINKANTYVIANKFDYYRHSVATTGRPGSNYQAAWNIFGPNAIGHMVDAHRDPDGAYAGEWVVIHHNTFMASGQRPIYIRAPLVEGGEVYNNRFFHNSNATVEYCVRPDITSKVRVFNNMRDNGSLHEPYEIRSGSINYVPGGFSSFLVPHTNICGPGGYFSVSLPAPTGLCIIQ